MPGIVRGGPGEFGSPENASASVYTCVPAAVGEGVRGRVVSRGRRTTLAPPEEVPS
jgi:hypothetical protein